MPGTFAELVSVKASNVFPFPKGFTFAQAAALGTTFITAYRMLFTRGRMTPGEWVLVTGIGGGLGVSLFQLARPLAGKLFVTSSSADKIERARGMGADGAVNYREDYPGKAIRHVTGKRGVDLVVDSAAGDSLEPSLRALRKGGRLVNAGATVGPKVEDRHAPRVLEPDRDHRLHHGVRCRCVGHAEDGFRARDRAGDRSDIPAGGRGTRRGTTGRTGTLRQGGTRGLLAVRPPQRARPSRPPASPDTPVRPGRYRRSSMRRWPP